MDPEEIYAEVLKEEQAKGSAAPVAEARAKAARQRAVHGSPHPKEPKWWAGAQPHLDGGEAPAADGAAEDTDSTPAPAEPEPEQAVAEAPVAADQPDAAVAHVDVADPPPSGAPPAEPVPTDQRVAAAAPAQPAAAAAPAQPAAVAAAAQPAPAPAPTGVTHGTPTGNRMRPEDGVATEAQLQGQQAMYDRRKLIDELVSSGVPTISASDAGRSGSPGLALMYIVIVLLAVFVIVQNAGGGAEPAGAEAPVEEGAGGEGGGEGGGAGGGLTVSAANVAFDTDTIELAAGEEAQIHFINEDSLEHNISIYETQEEGVAFENALFEGEVIDGGEEINYDVPALEAGERYFQCDVHPNMNGAVLVE